MDFRELGNTCVIGLQWGDEGKGKIVDLLTEHFDVVVRYGGGANAGHTIQIDGEKFALHLLPSGVLRPHISSIIGPGVAVDLEVLSAEVDELAERGVSIGDNLLLSRSAHLVLPYHKKEDRLAEARLDPARRIGTTAKGIGPCLADKMMRTTAFRVDDLFHPDAFRARLTQTVAQRNERFNATYGDAEPLDAAAMVQTWLSYADRFARHVTDTTRVLHDAVAAGRRILFEGAQGALLDIDHGTFPYVTSSVCTAAGPAAGAGVPPSAVRSYVGVVKAYCTRVGGGPFPTELLDATGDTIRERGREYGTTTGRPRRCGWFDAVATRYAVALSGITELTVTHLDTLTGLPELRVCTGYRRRGRESDVFPADARSLSEVEPVYELMPGWDEDITEMRDGEQLPPAARRYLDRMEALLDVSITLVGLGADRSAILHRTREPGNNPAPHDEAVSGAGL